MLAQLRCATFWMLDFFKGREVRRAYCDIKEIDHLDADDKYIEQYQKQAWENLRQHACITTEFYKNLDDKQLSEFPIIDKNQIKSNQGKFMSSAFDKKNLYQMATSGSTGTPFICFQNKEKKRRVNAEIIYYSEKAGYKLGSNLSYIRTIVRRVQKSKIKQLLQNQTLINCMNLDDSGIEVILEQLKNFSRGNKVTLLAYGSTYTAIKNYINKHPNIKSDDIHISGMISGSDMLFNETREVLENFFHCKMVSRYSNEENGVLGQDEGINNVFTVNEANYVVEILNEAGQPLPYGQVGRIVVTDLYNYAMPMIRYDTGDAGAIEIVNINGRTKRVISKFAGRQVDMIYDTKGNLLSPFSITNHMWQFNDIKQFQFIQTGATNYKLKLNILAEDKASLEKKVIDVIKNIVGQDAEISVIYVDEIPCLKSGKFRYIANEWRVKS